MRNDSLNKANGGNPKSFKSKKELSEYIISAYDSGQTMLDIAKDVGRSKIYVSKIIHQVYDEEEIKVRQYDKLRGKNKFDFSKYKSTSGIYRVSFVENKRNGNDYWSYQYYENGRLRRIVSVNLYKLKVIVLDKGLDWIEFTDEASDLVLKYKETYDESYTKQGFTWAYSFKENNQLNFVSSVNISTLKAKVLAKGWQWIELTDEATRLVEENSKKLQDKN